MFLQLADELRRAGANERAVRVLQEGLSHHPDSVSGRVALGRLQLELGDASAAAETLERALARDPAQMVASKLLIEAWIRMGDATRARERLDLYRILQERDAEIDDYERRITAMERSERLAALDAVRASGADLAGGDEGSDREAASPPFHFGVRPLPPLDLASSLTPSPPAAKGPGIAARANAQLNFDARMPFGVIHEPVTSGARILAFLRSQALFAPGPAPMAPEPTTAAQAAPAVAAALEVEAAPSFAFVDAAAANAVEATDAIDLYELPKAPEPAAEPAPPAAFEQFSTLTFAAEAERDALAEVERDTLEEPLAHVLAEAGVEAATPPADGMAAGELALAAGARATEAAPVVSPNLVGPPSGTLARLYLEQGHFAEAEAEFRRVLAERPEDHAAMVGLKDVGRRRAADETVSGWQGATALSSPRPLRGVGLTERKIQTLRAYLARIQRGRPRAHVS